MKIGLTEARIQVKISLICKVSLVAYSDVKGQK